MNTKLKARVEARVTGNEAGAHNIHRVLPGNGFEATTLNAVNDSTIHKAAKTERTMIKTVGLLFAAPFIGLAFVIALPVIGIWHLAKLALAAGAKKLPATNPGLKKAMVMLKNIGLFFAAPFIALGYVIALPVAGFFMIARLAVEAHRKSAYSNS